MERIKRIYGKLLRKTGITKNRKIPPPYTKEVLKDKSFHIGEYTYGVPRILFKNKDTKLYIGKFCSIAQNVTIFLGGNHRSDWISTYPFMEFENFSPQANSIIGHPTTNGDVIIENDVWIGRDAIIMSGVKICNGAIIAAGAVVTKDINPYEIWGGNPAKLIRRRFDEDQITELLKLEWWNWDVEKIKEKIPILCSSKFELLLHENI